MNESNQQDNLSFQPVWMCLLGALAGLSMWFLFDFLVDVIENQRLFLWLSCATLGFFVLLFALLGSLRWQDAVAASAVLSLFDAALLYWASGRFLEFDNLFEDSFAPVAWGLILFIGAPFAAGVLHGRARDYAFLFDTAWNIVVRYLAAWLFVGLFWGVLFLSDALLGIVGVTIIEDLLDFDPIPFVLTGFATGLALNVAQDLKAYVSPYLPLRLLRLLLPIVLLVVVIFILALPLRGLSQLFGSFSAAGILMSVAIAAITLITSALDREDADGVQSRLMQHATKALALLLPVLSGLALWAVWLRVSEYGWTPQRISASLAALLVFAYGLLYGLAVFQRSQWRHMVRQTNIAMALTVAGLSALWMTPLMNAQYYSAEAQLAKYLRAELSAEDFPAWEITHSWGLAGQAVIAQLRDLEPNAHAEIQTRLDRALELSRWEFNQGDDVQTIAALATEMQSIVQIWPEGQSLPEAYFKESGRHRLESWTEDCRRDESRPCVLIFGPFSRQGSEKGILFVPVSDGGARVFSASGNAEIPSFFSDIRVSTNGENLSEESYQQLKSGGYRIGPSTRQSLWLGDLELIPDN